MDSINKARNDLARRLDELRPYLQEAARIRRLLRVMEEAEVEEATSSLERVHVSSETRQTQILALLRDAGEPMRVRDLAGALAITSGRVSQLVTQMVEAGHVKRTDRGVEITSEGLDLVPPELNFRIGSWQVVDIDD